jgi:hypothetical protein
MKRLGAVLIGTWLLAGCSNTPSPTEGSGTMKQGAPQNVPPGYGDMYKKMQDMNKGAMDQAKTGVNLGDPRGRQGIIPGGSPGGAPSGPPGAPPGGGPPGGTPGR